MFQADSAVSLGQIVGCGRCINVDLGVLLGRAKLDESLLYVSFLRGDGPVILTHQRGEREEIKFWPLVIPVRVVDLRRHLGRREA